MTFVDHAITIALGAFTLARLTDIVISYYEGRAAAAGVRWYGDYLVTLTVWESRDW